jgi:hypothetical protein
VSGNPGGYSRAKLLSDASRQWLAMVDETTGLTNAELIVRAMGKKLLQDSAQHFVAMADRTEGRPPQSMTIGGSLDVDVEQVHERIRTFTARIREGIRKP